MERQYSPVDRLLIRLQEAVGAVAVKPPAPRAHPAQDIDVPELDDAARRHAAGLMRVNHAGEVAAQALYQGHALAARTPAIREHMLQAASEERVHLEWCEQRLQELGEGPSRLDPLWYAGSFAIGAVAGVAGDRWSLGFVEETEKQVAEHLRGHLDQLPEGDARSRAIVEAMQADEERHGADAAAAGAQVLPRAVQRLMRAVARVMTRSAYWV
ncbi:MAG TPA: 2-polyprenyl-3-methyl-6-methoxy-1,4-benzoquinone monooxygenase [Verrucomicrobiae bacterium]|nr:2-polyprenyl-3-methyl-6-methoxy-1,4-benzoquinone monooxygenase [Verrucomicrobiae bacterium]